jgi:hypothetical protein
MGEVAVGLSSTEEVGLSSTEGTRTESQIASISGANIFSASSGRDDNKNGLLVSTEATVSQGSNLEMKEVEMGLSSTGRTKTESNIESTTGFSFADKFSGSYRRDDAKNGLLVSTEATVSQGSHLEMGEVEVGLSSTEGTKTESQIASISGANIFSASSGRDDANNGYLISTEATVSPR